MEGQPGPLSDPLAGRAHLDTLRPASVRAGVRAHLDRLPTPLALPEASQPSGPRGKEFIQFRLRPAPASALPPKCLRDFFFFAVKSGYAVGCHLAGPKRIICKRWVAQNLRIHPI